MPNTKNQPKIDAALSELGIAPEPNRIKATQRRLTTSPPALWVERKREQNRRNVKKNAWTARALREMHQADWDAIYGRVSKELDSLPNVGEPCHHVPGCSGIEGLRGQHKEGCPGESAAKFDPVEAN